METSSYVRLKHYNKVSCQIPRNAVQSVVTKEDTMDKLFSTLIKKVQKILVVGATSAALQFANINKHSCTLNPEAGFDVYIFDIASKEQYTVFKQLWDSGVSTAILYKGNVYYLPTPSLMGKYPVMENFTGDFGPLAAVAELAKIKSRLKFFADCEDYYAVKSANKYLWKQALSIILEHSSITTEDQVIETGNFSSIDPNRGKTIIINDEEVLEPCYENLTIPAKTTHSVVTVGDLLSDFIWKDDTVFVEHYYDLYKYIAAHDVSDMMLAYQTMYLIDQDELDTLFGMCQHNLTAYYNAIDLACNVDYEVIKRNEQIAKTLNAFSNPEFVRFFYDRFGQGLGYNIQFPDLKAVSVMEYKDVVYTDFAGTHHSKVPNTIIDEFKTKDGILRKRPRRILSEVTDSHILQWHPETKTAKEYANLNPWQYFNTTSTRYGESGEPNITDYKDYLWTSEEVEDNFVINNKKHIFHTPGKCAEYKYVSKTHLDTKEFNTHLEHLAAFAASMVYYQMGLVAPDDGFYECSCGALIGYRDAVDNGYKRNGKVNREYRVEPDPDRFTCPHCGALKELRYTSDTGLVCDDRDQLSSHEALEELAIRRKYLNKHYRSSQGYKIFSR